MKYYESDLSEVYSSTSSTSEPFDIKKVRKQKKWTKEEDDKLIKLVRKHREKNWKVISKQFKNKDALQCFSRYKRIRPGISRGSWKPEEDQQILDLVDQYGKEWSKIARIMVTRNGKQIRDRFINVLDPAVNRAKFTHEEDLHILKLFKQMGPKWASMTQYFDRRSADMIKNRFYSSIKKKMENKVLVVDDEINSSLTQPINLIRLANTNNTTVGPSVISSSSSHTTTAANNCSKFSFNIKNMDSNKTELDEECSINIVNNCTEDTSSNDVYDELANSIFNINFDNIFPQQNNICKVQKKESFRKLVDWNFEEYFLI